MKSPSVYLLLGVCVLLLTALTVSAVLACLPPFLPLQTFFHLVVIIPYFVSTYLMVSIYKAILPVVPITLTERSLAICMDMATLERGNEEGCNEDYDDIYADVTTTF